MRIISINARTCDNERAFHLIITSQSFFPDIYNDAEGAGGWNCDDDESRRCESKSGSDSAYLCAYQEANNISTRRKAFNGENKQIFRSPQNVKLFIYFTSLVLMRFRMCLLSLHFYKRISWWNQEQMFVDKQFRFVSSRNAKIVISWAAWRSWRLQKFFFWARNSISRLNEFFVSKLVSLSLLCFIFE